MLEIRDEVKQKLGATSYTTLQNETRKNRLQRIYEVFHPPKEEVAWNSLVWSNYHPPRASFLAWIVCHERLPTKTQVSKCLPLTDVQCHLCGIREETTEHLFFECTYSKLVMSLVIGKMGIKQVPYTLTAWINGFATAKHKNSILLRLRAAALCTCIYQIWHARNIRIHEGKEISPETSSFTVLTLLKRTWFNTGIGSSRKTKEIGIQLGLLRDN